MSIFDFQLIITRSEVNLGKETGSLKLGKKVINCRDRILILDDDLVQLAVIYAHSERSIFLTHKENWCTPQGYTGSDKTFVEEVF